MASYADVDGVIADWVKATGSPLFTEWAGEPARFFYIPGIPPFECFQISLNPPFPDRIAVFARTIDTNDNTEEELEEAWGRSAYGTGPNVGRSSGNYRTVEGASAAGHEAGWSPISTRWDAISLRHGNR